MRKLLFLAAFPMLCAAHSQPQGLIEKLTPWESESIKIQLSNYNTYPQSYYVAIDDRVVGQTTEFAPNERGHYTVRLNTEAGATIERRVCTIIVTKEGATVNTKMCTTVRLERP